MKHSNVSVCHANSYVNAVCSKLITFKANRLADPVTSPLHLTRLAILALLSLFIMPSCSRDDTTDETTADNANDSTTITIRFTFPETRAYTRASSAADLRHIFITDIQDEFVQQTIHQTAADDDFGAPAITLAPGTHTLRILATDFPTADISGTAITQTPLGDTFYSETTIITTEAPEYINISISRIVAKVLNQTEDSHTVTDALQTFSLGAGRPSSTTTSVTLAPEQETYTYIPSSGKLTLENGSDLPVIANHITILTVPGPITRPMSLDADYTWDTDTTSIEL